MAKQPKQKTKKNNVRRLRAKKAKKPGSHKPPQNQNRPAKGAPQAAAAGRTRPVAYGGVPGPDAFDNLPKRSPPPSMQNQFQEVETRVSASGQGGTKPKTQGQGKKSSSAQSKPPEKKRRRVSPARRRRNRRVAAVLGIILLIGAGVWFSTSVLFKIKDYTVVGDSPYTAEEIIAAFGREPGENMFGFGKSAVQSRMERMLPYISKVTITRKLPDTIVLKVTAAEEKYVVPLNGKYAILSAERKVLRIADDKPEGLTGIQGLVGVQAEPGTKLSVEPQEAPSKPVEDASTADGSGAEGDGDAESVLLQGVQADENTQSNAGAERMDSFELLLAALHKANITDVTWIDVEDPLNLKFAWQDRIVVNLGNKAALDEKLVLVNHLMIDPATRKIDETEHGVLNASAYPLNQDRVYFTPE